MFFYKLKEIILGPDDERRLLFTTSVCHDWISLNDQYSGIRYFASQHPEYVFSEWEECEFLVYYRANETVPDLKDFEVLLEADPEHWQKGKWIEGNDDGCSEDFLDDFPESVFDI